MSEIVGLAGDWHGNTQWARESIRLLGQAGVKRIYHLGDFGIWPGDGGRHYLDRANAVASHFGISIWVTPGNHEDYDQIAAAPIDADDGLQWVRSHVALIPRGHRWEQEGRTFVSLGGAPSIDFEQRTEGVSWWRAEMVTLDEAERVASGGYADVMLAHDSPDGGAPAVQEIVNTPADRNPWSSAGLAYAREGRQLMNVAIEGIKPALFAHGHFHVASDSGLREGTRYLALAGDGMPQNIALLRLSDLAVSWDGRVYA